MAHGKTIDSCYEGVIAKLTAQQKIVPMSQKLLTFTQNDERVLYVYEIMKKLNMFPKVLDVRKADNVSTYYRNLGNQCFQKSSDFEAWQYYNLSLLYAPLDSENFSIAISNRSAVLLSLKRYEECLIDIENVLTLKYPEKLKDKLCKRQAQCNDALKKKPIKKNYSNEIKSILSIQGQKDERYICASKKLQVVFNEEMGRHVIARENIKVGEVLVEEDPYFSILLKDQFLFTCAYCLSRSANLIPCDNCCFTLYCSIECKNKASEEYHSVECPLMASLIELDFTKIELLSLRTVIKARSEHGDWRSLLETVEGVESRLKTEYRGHVKVNNQWVYDSQYYASIHSLASNIEKRSISDIFQKALTAAVFLHFLLEKTNFLSTENDTKGVIKFVAGTLLLHVMTSATNMHGLTANIETDSGDFVEQTNIASAPYAFLSLLNHSCAPNVVRMSKLGTGKTVLFVLRPIKKGMQIFDNYGSHHALESRMERQYSLKFQYKFTCVCEACVNNWPQYLFMQPSVHIPGQIVRQKEALLSSDAIEKLQKGDVTSAINLFEPLCKLAETLESYAPCKELADCQETLKQCLAIFEGLVPHGYSKLVEWWKAEPLVPSLK